jgi:hypothetical protein
MGSLPSLEYESVHQQLKEHNFDAMTADSQRATAVCQPFNSSKKRSSSIPRLFHIPPRQVKSSCLNFVHHRGSSDEQAATTLLLPPLPPPQVVGVRSSSSKALFFNTTEESEVEQQRKNSNSRMRPSVPIVEIVKSPASFKSKQLSGGRRSSLPGQQQQIHNTADENITNSLHATIKRVVSFEVALHEHFVRTMEYMEATQELFISSLQNVMNS